ncbi:MAG: hypothetical protein ABI411_05435 [Tahibacter sp.]
MNLKNSTHALRIAHEADAAMATMRTSDKRAFVMAGTSMIGKPYTTNSSDNGAMRNIASKTAKRLLNGFGMGDRTGYKDSSQRGMMGTSNSFGFHLD